MALHTSKLGSTVTLQATLQNVDKDGNKTAANLTGATLDAALVPVAGAIAERSWADGAITRVGGPSTGVISVTLDASDVLTPGVYDFIVASSMAPTKWVISCFLDLLPRGSVP